MILIIDTNKRSAESISDIFYYMGIMSKAATPKEALSEISSVYRAVLVSNPESFPDIRDYMEKLVGYCSAIPVFSISDTPHSPLYRDLFSANYHSSVYSSSLAMSIMQELKERNMSPIGTYRLAGIDASCDMKCVTSLDKPVPFTKTEVMILRYLILTYPIPQSPRNILKYAFKPSKKPEITSIRTHISVMNKKYREIRDRNVIISIPEKGYSISTPEILKSLSEAN